MEFSIKQGSPEKLRCGCVVAGVFEGGKLSGSAQMLDKASQRHISSVIAKGDMSGKTASTLLLHSVSGVAAERVLLVGLGKADDQSSKSRVDILRALFKALQDTPAKDAALFISDDSFGKDAEWIIKQATLAAAESGFRADGMKSKPAKPPTLAQIICASLDKPAATLKTLVDQTAAITRGMGLTKTLGNQPPRTPPPWCG